MSTSLIRPIFDFATNAAEYTLAEGEVEVVLGDASYSGDGTAVLQITPRPRVLLKGNVAGVALMDALGSAFGKGDASSFDFRGKSVDGFSGGISGSLDAETQEITWHPRKEPVIGRGDESTCIQKLVFHLFNYRDFTSRNRSSEKRESEHRAIENVEMVGSGLTARINSIYESSDAFRDLKREGGYRLTHVGSVEHSDGSSFTGETALAYLGQLGDFLSFTNGARCFPICSCGLDERNQRVWEAWSSPRAASGWVSSWFDKMHCCQIESFFEVFSTRCENDIWKKALHESIYWYLNANASSRGTDAGIILTQSALELLAYTYIVLDKQMLSAQGFKDLRASDRVRLLLSSIGIPTTIPDQCKDITALIADKNNQLNWDDLPHALTEIRNSLVHPDKKNRDQMCAAYFDAWNAGLWCLELSVLGVCGYAGTYSNRLKERWAGQVEDVPWIAH